MEPADHVTIAMCTVSCFTVALQAAALPVMLLITFINKKYNCYINEIRGICDPQERSLVITLRINLQSKTNGVVRLKSPRVR